MTTTAPDTGAAAGPLGFMQQLSPFVYLWQPSSPENATPTPKTDDPALVLLFGWMNAGGGPLAKYVRQYQVLFPTSAILLVTCSFVGMMIPRLGLQRASIAATTARAILEDDKAKSKAREAFQGGGDECPRLLIHAFSNAGSTMLWQTYKAFEITGSSDELASTVIPLHVSIFDSMPVPFSCRVMSRGMIDSVPTAAGRILAAPVTYIFVLLVWVWLNILRQPDHIGHLSLLAHNDPERAREAVRVYIYSPVDRVIPPKAVENHADEALSKGFRVHRELFLDTDHVAHAKKYSDRYWSIVAQTWQGARAESRL
jgi:hypothetical protein